MKKRIFIGGKIEGNVICEKEKVLFKRSIEITGSLKAKSVVVEGNIYVHGSYEVTEEDIVRGDQTVGRNQEVGGHQVVDRDQIVGGYQEVGRHQIVGGYQKIGEWQNIGDRQEVGSFQIISRQQEVNGSQKIGRFQQVGGTQKVNGDIIVEDSIVTIYDIRAKGKISCGGHYTIAAGLGAPLNNLNHRIIEATEVRGKVVCGIVKLIPEKTKIVIGEEIKGATPEQLAKIKEILQN